MTAITGHKCDVCDKFSLTNEGWLKLGVHGNQRPDPGWPDICSNRCLVELGLLRLREVDGEEYDERKSTKEKRTYLSEEDRELCLVRAAEVGTAAAASEFGVAPSTVRNWLKTMEAA